MNKNIQQAQALTSLQFGVNFAQLQATDPLMNRDLDSKVTLRGILATAVRNSMEDLRIGVEEGQVVNTTDNSNKKKIKFN